MDTSIEKLQKEKHTVAVYRWFKEADSTSGALLLARNSQSYVNNKTNWDLAGVYVDFGEERGGFRKLLHDVIEKKIDLILVKSKSHLGENDSEIKERVLELKNNAASVKLVIEAYSTMELFWQEMLME